jgi:hypothetical protein
MSNRLSASRCVVATIVANIGVVDSEVWRRERNVDGIALVIDDHRARLVDAHAYKYRQPQIIIIA